MSCQDVIELGSSDEETEPAPKRSKPMVNAMVCIPSKLPEVTIKPAKSNIKPIPKLISGKGLHIQKVLNTNLEAAMRYKLNGKPATGSVLKPKIAFNPYSEKHMTDIQIKPCNSKIKIVKPPVQVQKRSQISLPPSITVKRTISSKLSRPILTLNVKNKNKPTVQVSKVPREVLTVELDDDEVPVQSSDSPQWYIRPEEHKDTSALEKENNKEPDASKITEIMIEDSPVKPNTQKKRAHDVGTELAIVIEDSPIKAAVDKKKIVSGSENEDESASNEEPQSKKKLEYPREVEGNKTIEIEIDFNQVNMHVDSTLEKKVEDVNKSSLDNVQVKSNENLKVTKMDSNIEASKENETEAKKSDLNEYHPIYRNFIEVCFQLENSEDMKKIVEKKIKGYYKQVPKEYTESEEFTDMVSSKILSMKASPEKMYLYIKDIVDELNLQRKLAKSQPVVEEPKNQEQTNTLGEECQYNTKRQRQIRKLEKTIKKLHRAIQKLEEQEVDFDDEDDSVYLLTERYKERMVRVYSKFCQLSNTKMPSEPRIQIDARPGQPPGPAKRLEKWINKKVPIGTPLPFPDFHDVLRCVREANEEDKLCFNEADIMEEARDLFVRCGKKLQRRRQENEWRLAASRLTQSVDPSEKDSELQKKLIENKKIAAEKEIEILNKYADRQNQLKLEAEEIGDKEAEESPVESEEEVIDENASLETAEKRKDILRRLIQSKKSPEEKELTILSEGQANKNENTEIETIMEESVSVENEMESDIVPALESIIKSDTDTNIEIANNNRAAVGTKPLDHAAANNSLLEKKDDEKHDDNIDTNQPNNSLNATETFSLSDDSNALESDMDELHLLQKLYSADNGEDSTVDSSDSGTPIAISDSEDSNEERKKPSDDVISIENSSYSEDEKSDNLHLKEYNSQLNNEEIKEYQDNETSSPTDDNNMNKKFDGGEIIHSNNDEYDGLVEDVLLASTEEENSQDEPGVGSCFNRGDDLISIDETDIAISKGSTIADKLITTNLNKDIEYITPVKENNESKEVVNDDLLDKSSKKKSESLETSSQKTNVVVLLDDHSNESIDKESIEQHINKDNESEIMKDSEDIAPVSQAEP